MPVGNVRRWDMFKVEFKKIFSVTRTSSGPRAYGKAPRTSPGPQGGLLFDSQQHRSLVLRIAGCK